MQFLAGWSGTQPNGDWRKADILMEDQDITAVMIEWGLDPAQVGHIDKYRIAESEANRLLLFHLITTFPGTYNTTAYKQELQGYMGVKTQMVAKYADKP